MVRVDSICTVSYTLIHMEWLIATDKASVLQDPKTSDGSVRSQSVSFAEISDFEAPRNGSDESFGGTSLLRMAASFNNSPCDPGFR